MNIAFPLEMHLTYTILSFFASNFSVGENALSYIYSLLPLPFSIYLCVYIVKDLRGVYAEDSFLCSLS